MLATHTHDKQSRKGVLLFYFFNIFRFFLYYELNVILKLKEHVKFN